MTLRKGLAVVETLAAMQAEACAHDDELVRLGCPRLDLDRDVCARTRCWPMPARMRDRKTIRPII